MAQKGGVILPPVAASQELCGEKIMTLDESQGYRAIALLLSEVPVCVISEILKRLMHMLCKCLVCFSCCKLSGGGDRG